MATDEMMRIISRNITRLMKLHQMNNRDLAEKLNVSESTVGKWLLMKAIPRMGIIEQMAELFNVNKSDILLEENKNISNIVSIPKTGKRIPILGTIAAGVPILAQQSIEGYVDIDEALRADFALRVQGDSMIGAYIRSGDLVLVRQQPTVEEGEIAAVAIKTNGDYEATLKRVRFTDGGLVLWAENSAYQPIICTNGTCEDVKIMGKAVTTISSVR